MLVCDCVQVAFEGIREEALDRMQKSSDYPKKLIEVSDEVEVLLMNEMAEFLDTERWGKVPKDEKG